VRPQQPPIQADSATRRIGRRHFLQGLGAVVGVVAVHPVRAAAPSVRCVSFRHTHTGETLTAAYWKDGRYQPDCLLQVNQLLRDFRTNEVHPIDPGLLDILFELRTRAGSERAFEVISGYRSPQTNAMLRRNSEGVAQHSLHLVGQAIDVRLPDVATSRVAELACTLERGGVGFYPASDFVHVDTGRVRYW
jgi:uncharacterized protein YcbK (DUF882 family)